MYHTGLDPFTGEKVRVPKDSRERALQRALLRYWTPEGKRAAASAERKIP
jgi:hypothetical protein